ncbi:MAG: hypothetical protein J7521_20110 [Caulobacter sp.]|nr:hypothetical protein [Caulobacter sp.]
MAKLTKAQQAMLEQARERPCRADLMTGSERTYASLRDRGLMTIERQSGGLRWAALTDAGRAALAQAEKSRRFMGPDNRYGHALAALSAPASDGSK